MGKFEKDSLDALQRAVTKALDRKRRLGQYAVLWEENRMVLVGPDAPREQELSRSLNTAKRIGDAEPERET